MLSLLCNIPWLPRGGSQFFQIKVAFSSFKAFWEGALNDHRGAQIYRGRDLVPAMAALFWWVTELSRDMFTSANVYLLQVYKTWQTNLWKWPYLQKQVLEVRGHAGLVLVLRRSWVMMKTWQAMFGWQTTEQKKKKKLGTHLYQDLTSKQICFDIL